MTTLYFSKDPEHRRNQGEELDLPDWSKQYRPEQYVIEDDGLVAAINAALILGQPLLLTGEPGTGKTTLAARVVWQLGLDVPLTFETKSTSVARDLIYTYDAVGRFQAAQDKNENADNLNFITFQAIGRAIRVIDTEKGKVLMTMNSHRGGVNYLSLRLDGRLLASGGSDHTNRLWNSSTGVELARWTTYEDSVTAISFSPDGTTLASGSADGIVKFWHLPTFRQELTNIGLDWHGP